jgi:hypothetical protein
VLPGQRTRSQAQHLPFSRDQAITYLRYEHAGTNDYIATERPVQVDNVLRGNIPPAIVAMNMRGAIPA